MQATAAANRGSTRLLEYLSCDGSRWGGGGALVLLRRSIIPRLRCAFDNVALEYPRRADVGLKFDAFCPLACNLSRSA